jgi:hypothetical protein
MRQGLFVLAALVATAAVITLPFVAFRLLAEGRMGWFWGARAIIILADVVFLARRR